MSDSINVYLSDEDLEKINGGMEVRVKTAEGLLLTFFPPVIARPDEDGPKAGKNIPGGNEDVWTMK